MKINRQVTIEFENVVERTQSGGGPCKVILESGVNEVNEPEVRIVTEAAHDIITYAIPSSEFYDGIAAFLENYPQER